MTPSNANRPVPNPPFDFDWRVGFDPVARAQIVKIFLKYNALETVVLPAEIDGLPVTELFGPPSDDSVLTSVTLSDHLHTVADDAFARLEKLTQIRVTPGNARFRAVDGVLFTADGKEFVAYPSAKKGDTFLVPAEVERVARKAFPRIPALARFEVAAANKSLQSVDGVLFTADGKTLLRYPPAKRVADAKYVVPDGVERIADGAFADVYSLIAVELPETLQIIGEEAFMDSALRSIKLNEGLAEIGDNAFAYAPVAGLDFPSTLKKIGDYAFKFISSVAYNFIRPSRAHTVTLPENFQELGRYSFARSHFCRLVIPCSLQAFDYQTIDAAEFCVAPEHPTLRSIDGVLFTADGKTLLRYPIRKNQETYNVPDGVETFAPGAFGCSSDFYQALKSLTLPASFKSFHYASSRISREFGLTTMFRETPRHFRSVDSVVFSGDGKTLLSCPRDKSGDYVVPDGVETIDDYAFYKCNALTSITFPDGLKNIGVGAFSGCDKLTSVTFPDSASYDCCRRFPLSAASRNPSATFCRRRRPLHRRR